VQKKERKIMADDLELQFKKAIYFVRNAPAIDSSNEEKLKFYALYKQATEGDVKGSQPWAVQFEARAKWDAWNDVKGISKEKAMQDYIGAVAAGAADWLTSDVLKDFKAE
jgi:diazepam-binding inhibitor (GABA receptor modulator, acyl-CoA-binding protein)